MSILEYIEKYGGLSNGEHLVDVTVNLAGIEIWEFLFLFCFVYDLLLSCLFW